MKTTVVIILLNAALILSFNSCKKSETSTQPSRLETSPNKYLMDLSIGNSWTYRRVKIDSTGKISKVDTITYFIRTDTVVNGKVWSLMGSNEAMSEPIGYRNDDYALYKSNFVSLEVGYPYPTKTGNIYANWSIVSTDTIVPTPIGDLHCICYRSFDYGIPFNVFYAPEIGLVHEESLVKPFGYGDAYIAITQDLIAKKSL